VEDQQPAAGDLTVDAAAALDETDESDTLAVDEIDSADRAADAQATTPTAAGGVRARRPAGRWLSVAVLVAAVLFVGSAAFAGAAVQPYLADRATVATKLNVARAAANAITTLWTYTPDNMNTLADRAAAYLSGDFGAQYRKFVDGIVAPNKQAQITNNTEVSGAAVESLDDPNAVVIVFTNTTSTSPLTKNIPSLKYLSYRLFMKRASDRWLVTRMTTVTSLDVTPQL
jgi:Mce-associated membrane protein